MIIDVPMPERAALLASYSETTDDRAIAKGVFTSEDFAEAQAEWVALCWRANLSRSEPQVWVHLSKRAEFGWLEHGIRTAPARRPNVVSVRPAVPDPNTAVGKIEIAASAVLKAEPRLTHEQAVAKALATNPDLYDRLMNETHA